jgi:uncharacterized membrane protein YphA (DoxX/SURF4 family)
MSGGKKALDLGVTFPISRASLPHGALCLRWRHKLQKLFSAFPAGWPGLGLILLRIAVALGAITQGLNALPAPGGPALIVRFLGILAIIGGLFILAGFLTPVAGAAAMIGFLAMGIARLLNTDAHPHGDAILALHLAVMSLALVLLGPGAISLDARLFGRREIIISESRRSPRA